MADVVLLTYACDRPETLDYLSKYWIPELRRMEVKVPVVVAGCKLDRREEQHVSLEQIMSPIMQQFREIETCIECSALKQVQVIVNVELVIVNPSSFRGCLFSFEYVSLNTYESLIK